MPPDSRFPLRAFFGHHKCATSWIDQILMEICFHLGLNFKIVHRPVEWEEHGSLPALVDAHDADFVAYTNAKRENIQDLPFDRGFHVVRDPRDILVSAYFSHLNSHPTDNWPELEPHRENLQSASKEEGLFLEMDFSAEEFEDMYNWDYSRDDVLELKLEEISPEPVRHFTEIINFLGMLDHSSSSIQRAAKSALLTANRWLYKGRHLISTEDPPRLQRRETITKEKLHDILEKKSFENLSNGREKGEEDPEHHFRKGVPGDWVNHFTPEHKRVFKERFNDVLVKLGYEDDDDW